MIAFPELDGPPLSWAGGALFCCFFGTIGANLGDPARLATCSPSAGAPAAAAPPCRRLGIVH
jgi:hypothetical protein